MPAAYQDENGKWFKQCSTTKQIFGPVDNKEDLSEWFSKNKNKFDGFEYFCRLVNSERCKSKDIIHKIKRKQYREKNKSKIKEKDKHYRNNNQHKIKQYYKSPRGLLALHKARAKKRGINFILTLEWFEEQMTKPEFNFCAISSVQFVDSNGNSAEPFARSLDRISSTKGYTPDNVRWVCFKYNSWKSDLTLEDIARIFKYTAQSHNLDPHEILNQVS